MMCEEKKGKHRLVPLPSRNVHRSRVRYCRTSFTRLSRSIASYPAQHGDKPAHWSMRGNIYNHESFRQASKYKSLGAGKRCSCGLTKLTNEQLVCDRSYDTVRCC